MTTTTIRHGHQCLLPHPAPLTGTIVRCTACGRHWRYGTPIYALHPRWYPIGPVALWWHQRHTPALAVVPEPDEPTRVTLPEIIGVHAVRHTPDGIPLTACGVSIYTPRRHAVPDDTEVTCWRCREALAQETGP